VRSPPPAELVLCYNGPMKAMVLSGTGRLEEGAFPLELREVPAPEPGPGEVLVRVSACGVCHTELDEIEGRTPPPRFPVIPGHQAIGRVERTGPGASLFKAGDRVGIAWIYAACGHCSYCLTDRENLCPEFQATGRDVDGGYAEYLAVSEAFAHPIPGGGLDVEAAPLLCAGAIGYRSLRLAGLRNGQPLGLAGFGASGHLVLKLARHDFPQSDVFVFARSERERAFALELGARWAGGIEDPPPEKLMAIIDTTPVWRPVVQALRHLAPGGRLVINAIRKEEADKDALLGLDYPDHLWMEKEVKSVANVTRRDVREFLAKASEMKIRPEVETYALAEANVALAELKLGRIRGAKVLKIQ
jgi:propanol-preferring alcohol dehydrogenase